DRPFSVAVKPMTRCAVIQVESTAFRNIAAPRHGRRPDQQQPKTKLMNYRTLKSSHRWNRQVKISASNSF
ncbi:MAG TPA: hypothetical protein VFE56_08655, partial [Candidatus Binataceae bacterium]|nr:hypothetical protein [Candidatus Binataceae bacterium]